MQLILRGHPLKTYNLMKQPFSETSDADGLKYGRQNTQFGNSSFLLQPEFIKIGFTLDLSGREILKCSHCVCSKAYQDSKVMLAGFFFPRKRAIFKGF